MKQLLAPLREHPVVGAVAIAVALYFVMASMGYASAFSIRSMLVLAALLAVASVGQTLVIIIGGIDLSIPFVIGFANVVAATLTGDGMPFWQVCLIVGTLAILIGAVSGSLSAWLKIHPLIVTLGIGTIVQGLVQLWTGGFPSGSAPAFVSQFVSIGGQIGPFGPIPVIPVPGLIPAVGLLMVAVTLLLAVTPLGRRLYALGGNPTAAPYALISPIAMWTIAFAISAFFAAVAGVLLLGFTGSAYGDVGQPYLFQTIAAVVVGGTSLMGGRGTYVGTVVGAIVLVQIRTILIGQGLDEALIQAAFGAIIIVLVSLYGREPHVRNTI